MALVALAGAVLTLRDPPSAVRCVGPALLLQLFAASSGFGVPARRGHYDLLLTRRSARLPAALAHWGASIAPGVLAWWLLGLAELAGSQGSRAALLASGTWSAMAVISTVPWACGVALPRFGGAIAWLVVMLATTNGLEVGGGLPAPTAGPGALVASAWSFLINPLGVVGVGLTRTEAMAVIPGLALGAAAMTAACVWVTTADVPLEAGQ